jgi:hypothetical protein
LGGNEAVRFHIILDTGFSLPWLLISEWMPEEVTHAAFRCAARTGGCLTTDLVAENRFIKKIFAFFR